jgi:hypothetical protein
MMQSVKHTGFIVLTVLLSTSLYPVVSKLAFETRQNMSARVYLFRHYGEGQSLWNNAINLGGSRTQ